MPIVLQNIYIMCLTHELVLANSSFGFVCLDKLILKNLALVQWNLCNTAPEFSNILWHPTKIYGIKVFLEIKLKPEYSNILYNPKHFPGPLGVSD